MMMTDSMLSRIQQNGRTLLNVTIVLLVIALSLSSCSSEWWSLDGFGDWTLDLIDGYCIFEVHAEEIIIGYKENPNDSRVSVVIPNYFVLTYQLDEPYIHLKGIHTQGLSITDEELYARVLSYYLIDTTNDEVIGPFESYDALAEYCSSLSLEIDDKWKLAKK